jgi:signal transduction histidine kinase
MLSAHGTLKGKPIRSYIPLLGDALQFGFGSEGLRAATQCQGFRDNGEIFLANLWFSSWSGPEGKRLAAILVDSSEDMREREEENLRQTLRANQIGAAAVSHEVRNLCAAISVVTANLYGHEHAASADVQALTSLVRGLERITDQDLQAQAWDEPLGDLTLRAVLDDLRIVIDPQWREMGGELRFAVPAVLPNVIAERHGLFQAFLNLSRNSLRAVRACGLRHLFINVSLEANKVLIRFEDSGPGVSAPERLFLPFQPGSSGAGLGLFVSRAVLRSFGGELRWEPSALGCCFVIELQTAELQA